MRNTNAKEFDYRQSGRQDRFNRKYKPSIEINAFHDIHRTEGEPIRTISR